MRTPFQRPAARAGRRQHKPGEMNQTEAAYHEILTLRKRAGEISDFWFEGIKLKLAPATFYTPDFLVQMMDGTLQLHECKAALMKDGVITGALIEDDAMVKLKVVAVQFPFEIVIARGKKQRGAFIWDEVKVRS